MLIKLIKLKLFDIFICYAVVIILSTLSKFSFIFSIKVVKVVIDGKTDVALVSSESFSSHCFLN